MVLLKLWFSVNLNLTTIINNYWSDMIEWPKVQPPLPEVVVRGSIIYLLIICVMSWYCQLLLRRNGEPFNKIYLLSSWLRTLKFKWIPSVMIPKPVINNISFLVCLLRVYEYFSWHHCTWRHDNYITNQGHKFRVLMQLLLSWFWSDWIQL